MMSKTCLESSFPWRLPTLGDTDSEIPNRECMKIILQDIWKSVAGSWDHLL